jgi:photosystem II stability/assembly factor-like uncharacterized protein
LGIIIGIFISGDSILRIKSNGTDVSKYNVYNIEQFNSIAQNKKKDRKNQKQPNDNPDKFAEYQRAIRTRYGQSDHDYQAGYKLSEYGKANQFANFSRARIKNLEWVEHGPGNVPGRTRTILNLPGDPLNNTWLAGAVGGGIWRTANGGRTWQNMSPDFPNLSIVSLAYSASDPNIIYAGTGESYGTGGLIEIVGQGMFKSVNGGEDWIPISSTTDIFNFMSVNYIVVDPADPDILLISVNQNVGRGIDFKSGIYKSVDGGDSWYQVFDPPAWVQQIVYEPDNFDVQYASVFGTGVAKSTDAGETWEVVSNGIYPAGRIGLAISGNNKNRLYATVEGELSGVESDFYISDDGAENWSLVVEFNNASNRNFFAATENSSAQGGWNNTVAVHPFNDDIAYVGGVDLWKMTMVSGTINMGRDFLGVTEDSTDQFMYFINFGATYWRGRLDIGDIPDEEFVSVEIRFGDGKTQKAHRFETPSDGGTNNDGGAGVPDEEYAYQDYVDVPFEVWDVEGNRQLMVSFRDQAKNGVWDLVKEKTEGLYSEQSREYIFIHNIDYDPESPEPMISVNGGQKYEEMYNLWPVSDDEFDFHPDSLPESKLIINWGELIAKQRRTVRMSTWLNESNETEDGRSLPYVHADQHSILPIIEEAGNGTFKLLVTNDGGVFQSKVEEDPGLDKTSWFFAGSGYNTSQFYGIDKKPGANEFVGGLQDNGSFLSPSGVDADSRTSYSEVGGGDGMETVWNYGNENEIIISIYNNRFSKTQDGGKTWYSATDGLGDVDELAPFITKLGNSKSDPEVLYAVGASGVWKSENFGDSWNVTEIKDNWILSTSMDVEVSKSNFNIVWAGSGMDEIRKIFVSTDAGETFNPVNNYDLVELGTITGIASHPTEDSAAYLLFSFAGAPKILRTTDLGQTWEDISGFGQNTVSNNGFPDVAVHSLFVMPHDPDNIWAGTEIGIFESFDNGQSWSITQTGFPSASVWDMKQVDDRVIVGTHGRGIWSTSIPELPEISVTPRVLAVGVSIPGDLVVKLGLRSSYDSTNVYVNDILALKLNETVKMDSVVNIDYNTEGLVSVYTVSFLNGMQYLSNSASFDFFIPGQVVDQYANDLNAADAEDDFSGNGFSIKTENGFGANDKAIHSPHFYKADTTYIYYLKVPIRIAENMSTFQYKDVALIETGEPGTKFGDFEFWDYVVIEGTMDGVNWIPIQDGYDARADEKWLSTYDSGGDGADNLYKKQDVNLLDSFKPVDEVMFRFRLYSDQFTVGWGWAVDDIYIQEERPLAIEPDKLNELSVKIYPNPVSDQSTIEFSLPSSENVEIRVRDMTGREIQILQIGDLPPGLHQYPYEVSSLGMGIYFITLETSRGQETVRLIKN